MTEHEWVFANSPFSQHGKTEFEIPVYCIHCGEEDIVIIYIPETRLPEMGCYRCEDCGLGALEEYMLFCEVCDETFCSQCLAYYEEEEIQMCRWCA